MKTFYSPSTGGFYVDAVHAEYPQDAVEITAEQYEALLEGESQGKRIAPPDADHAEPWLDDPPPPTATELINAKLAELQSYLASTDYIAIKIAEGAATKEEYADELAKRQETRERINELRAELTEMETADDN